MKYGTFIFFSQGSWSCSRWVEKHNPPPPAPPPNIRTKRAGSKPPRVRQEFKRWVKKNCHGKIVSLRDKVQRGCYHPCKNFAFWLGQEDRDCGGYQSTAISDCQWGIEICFPLETLNSSLHSILTIKTSPSYLTFKMPWFLFFLNVTEHKGN